MPKLNMTPNYVKKIMGHSRFTTTQDRYGNHTITSSEYELETAEAFEKSRPAEPTRYILLATDNYLPCQNLDSRWSQIGLLLN
jgi:hypothetical protein